MEYHKSNMFEKYPDLLGMSEVQEALRIGRSLAYRLINSQKIKCLRIGKIIKVQKRFLKDYVVNECYTGMVATSEPACQ